MNVFHCDHCEQLVFFENTSCMRCSRALAFVPELSTVTSLDPSGDSLWLSPLPRARDRAYRLCENYSVQNVCNWALPADDPHSLCVSCRLTRIIPDLSQPQNKEAWYKIETAKRRLVYSLLQLRCPLTNRDEDPENGLAFRFLADPGPDGAPVLTGHGNGLITLNIAEADDAERERRRQELDEPYRTLLGHFRHEIGHYYWDRLIDGSARIEPFRELFGDERRNYDQALKDYYNGGAPPDWQQRFVSEYASSHPWEDWAETWAHYLHMTDALETAAACGLSLRPHRANEPQLSAQRNERLTVEAAFDQLIEDWFPLTYVLNNLNRGLGLPDGYPFVLSDQTIEKLRFVHETIAEASQRE